ncbi:MFS transporter [Synechococcales cyanobacterium C]|uniref:MFS transporter n=1 Tax=Petrachloros mirabilis ULC683 TaxID=2781853 RepID=A0A8K1ZY73_9CYAN|nr:MFS transporter [Petrachloros mirabilis]NCJ06286.1 MFS transporter [Petrachloros mirabilis ULC683]
MNVPSAVTAKPQDSLNLSTKLAYGVGELSSEVPNSIMVFFLLFFFTNVAGLNPGLAGTVLLIGKAWDGINDPLVGWLSDRTRSRLGRRYPWMLWGAVPMGVCFALLWIVPPTQDQGLLMLYYGAIAVIFYAAYTAVNLPHKILSAELTQTYHERTSLAGFKATFSISSSIFGLLLARLIFSLVPVGSQRYMLLGTIAGGIACLAAYVCIWGTYRRFHAIQSVRDQVQRPPTLPLGQQFRVALQNRPFCLVVGIYLCSWMGVQVTAAILPYFVVNWMGLPDSHFTQMALAVQGTALAMMLVWSALGQRLGKKAIYCMGIPLTLLAQAGLFLVQPGQVGWMYGLAVMAGVGLATAYLVPWSMLPDVVDLDELQTGQRREGIFYSLVVQVQKIGIAIALFLVGKTLDWSGFISSTAGEPTPIQPEQTLWAIRWLIGPIPSLVLIVGLVQAALYPLNRWVHDDIVLKLQERRLEWPPEKC